MLRIEGTWSEFGTFPELFCFFFRRKLIHFLDVKMNSDKVPLVDNFELALPSI